MEENICLEVSEVAQDPKTAYECRLCNFNPYQEWCKGNKARFQVSLQKHLASQRHKLAEAIANGEALPSPPPKGSGRYISQLEDMIDKLNDKIEELVQTKLEVSSGVEEPHTPHPPRRFEWRDTEKKAICDFDNGSIINLTNISNALVRCINWCEINMEGEKKKKNVLYLTTTRDIVRNIADLITQGWNVEEDDYDELEGRLEKILRHQFLSGGGN